MECQHCGETNDVFAVGGVALCPAHRDLYFPDGDFPPRAVKLTLPGGHSRGLAEAARRAGCSVASFDGELTVTYPQEAVIEFGGHTLRYGEVMLTVYSGEEKDYPNVKVYSGGDGRHPHTSDYYLCLGTWEDTIREAAKNDEWDLYVALIYEAACHYYPLGAYYSLCLPCAACGHDTTRWCSACLEAPLCDGCCQRTDGACPACAQECQRCGQMKRLYACACPYCERVTCRACRTRCQACDESGCRDCVKMDYASVHCPRHRREKPVEQEKEEVAEVLAARPGGRPGAGAAVPHRCAYLDQHGRPRNERGEFCTWDWYNAHRDPAPAVSVG